MGMDVYGKNPVSETGVHFRNSGWSWGPLATYVCEVAPTITRKCQYWQSNDGNGLNASDSQKLAIILQREIETGRTAAYAKRFASEQEMTPDEECWLCDGTGTRKPYPEMGAGDVKTGLRCNACDGRGFSRPYSTYDRFKVEDVQKFAAFLRDCGGFQIW
jgi:hypothetical protein